MATPVSLPARLMDVINEQVEECDVLSPTCYRQMMESPVKLP
jgi:hypothetical protein